MKFPHASINEKIYSMKSNKCAICSEKADKSKQQVNGTILTSCGSFAEEQLQKQMAHFWKRGNFLIYYPHHLPPLLQQHKKALVTGRGSQPQTHTSKSKRTPQQLPRTDGTSQQRSKRKGCCKQSSLPCFSLSLLHLLSLAVHREI